MRWYNYGEMGELSWASSISVMHVRNDAGGIAVERVGKEFGGGGRLWEATFYGCHGNAETARQAP